MLKQWAISAALLIAASPAAIAAEPARVTEPLSLARVFASPDLAGSQPRLLKLSPDGKLLTSLRPRATEKDRFDLWAHDTATGREWMLIDSQQVGSGAALSEAEKMQRERARIGGSKGVVAYQWAPDSQSILVPLDGALYRAKLDGTVTRLTSGEGGELNPSISPGGRLISFVRDQNLFVQPVGGTAVALTSDGGGTVHWGEAEFVAQEEMARSTGYWWSPDDKRLAVARFDEAPVGVVTRAAIGADGTKVFDQRYPAAGTPNVLVALYVINADGGGRVRVDLGANPDIYLARVDWAPDGKSLLVQRVSRDQSQLDLLQVDPATGKSTLLFGEQADPKGWINLSDSYRLLRDGSLIWSSERDGYAHLYHVQDGRWTQLTKGPWVVTGLTGVDAAQGRVFFTGNKDGVLEQHLYAVDLARPNDIVRLTEPGWWNTATMDTTASRIIISRSNPSQPTQVYLAGADGKRLAWINENAVVAGHPYFPFLSSHRTPSFGTLTAADGSILYYEMLTPTLVPGKKYPVFFEHYGGPHAQTVSRNWGTALHQYLVAQGWIVFQLDNRGSANRGTAFEHQIFRAMGAVEVADQLTGATWLKQQSFVDPARIATYGWSYGGYMTLKMLQANPGVYAAGVSGAPVTKWQLYDTFYTERYLGNPATDALAYRRSNAIDESPSITDPLLLIHGMADDNVVLDNSTALAAKMQQENIPFEMMLYPGKTHSAGRDIHVWTTILNFLNRTVKDKPAGLATGRQSDR